MVVEGQRDTKNAALIPSVRTLVDSKLRVISIKDRPPWNSIGVPPFLVFCYTSRKIIDLLMIKEERIQGYLYGF
ncbi:hypothetical protein BHE74_00044448 [Ensete ventricosum]|uniref:Uncharacterized protein n=1 Tax=Ensete ventricosum TaxID=4639 RepID=A0A444DH76_ENSVE|nr:hypothetical protein GW17_00039709 [Ensete ventricosum]RWW49400.1 hypothetical protein BHE74_00044448 [Ensete ventricosum]RZR73072.1 hypothetical protein BHM03_00019755 [Ensete ventricosum]